MARIGLRLFLCPLVASLGFTALSAAGNDVEQRKKTLLAVQVALEKGQEFLQRGDFASAVAVLEKQVPYIDGNRRYLETLRDAYIGHVRQLEQAGKQAEARKYRSFLEILEPGTARAAAPMVTSEVIHRGKVEASDPFAETNRAASHKGNSLAQADRAFEERNYEEAGRLYARADQADPGSVSKSQERWGYCKLYAVAQRLNRSGNESAGSELEREIRDALRMAPKLEPFGQSLLARLGDRPDARERRGVSPPVFDSRGFDSRGVSPPVFESVPVKHTPRKDGGWALAETESFRIYHVLGEEKAEQIARIAESTRVTMTRKWFAEEARPWSPRCDIYVHPTGAGYAKATGAPAASPGHSTISLEGSRVVTRRVDLRGDDPNLLVGVLPHETTHVVLAGRFGVHHVPRWADEGMAVLSEPRERIEMHLRNLPTHRREGTLFSVSELMKMENYPEPRRVGPFYAQSVSLVDFLCRKKDPATFARFLREALEGRYDTALQRHFGYRSFTELEQEWKQSAFTAESVAHDVRPNAPRTK